MQPSLCFLLFLLLACHLPTTQSTTRLTSILTHPLTHSSTSTPTPTPTTTHQQLSSSPLTHSLTTTNTPMDTVVDLWVVGCGKLGMLVVKEWLQQRPGAVVVGETLTRTNHEALARLGAVPRLRSERLRGDFTHVKHILISFPPYSRSPNTAKIYLPEVEAAMMLPQTLKEASSANSACPSSSSEFTEDVAVHVTPRILLVSSTSVYGAPPADTTKHFIVTENSPVADPSNVEYSSSQRAVNAENIVLKGQHHGLVLRLAGLYDRYRGPHMFWLSAAAKLAEKGGISHAHDSETIPSLNLDAEGLVNLIHYEDAAALAVKILAKGSPWQIFMGCDNYPVSRREIIYSAARAKVIPSFVLPQDEVIFKPQVRPTYSKVCDGSFTKHNLAWKPQYPRFDPLT